MAGDWVKWQKGLEKKPEVYQIAMQLGVSRYEIAGRLMVLWSWCDDNLSDHDFDENGNATVALEARQRDVIDDVSGISGFADAMNSANWLVLKNGNLIFPNLARHVGQTSKARSLNSLRQRKNRNSQKNVSRFCRAKSATREEKRREENNQQQEEKEKFESSNSNHSNLYSEIKFEWNQFADECAWKPCSYMTDKRKESIRNRWRDAFWRDHWRQALEIAKNVKWLRGFNKRGWIANIDWFLRKQTVPKLIEGQYEDRANGEPSSDFWSSWIAEEKDEPES